jgi:hypothetical protein
MREDGVSGPLAVPLVWLGVRRDTSERIDRFASRLVFLFFPLAPVFWLIARFVGGGRILAAIWLLLLAFFVRVSWRLEKIGAGIARPDDEPWTAAKAKANFWKWYVIDLIVVAGATYAFDLSASWLSLFVVVPLVLRKRVVAYMMHPNDRGFTGL